MALIAVQGKPGFPRLLDYSSKTDQAEKKADVVDGGKMEIAIESFDMSLEQASNHIHYRKLIKT